VYKCTPSVTPSQELVLFCREDQLGSGRTQRVAIGHAVSGGMVNNETLGYFMARTQLFMERVGPFTDPLDFNTTGGTVVVVCILSISFVSLCDMVFVWGKRVGS
jgi:hypothetical protein